MCMEVKMRQSKIEAMSRQEDNDRLDKGSSGAPGLNLES